MINRRSFLSLGAGTAFSIASGRLWGLASIPMPAANNAVEEKLDTFTVAYMRAMNAPGMAQALTDAAATIRTVGYGFANVDLKAPVTPEHLFQIGSITKSFVALILLQLHDEGKLDLHRPVLEYLPWLPVTMPYGPITAHHLLTHTSGLPGASGNFSKRSRRPPQAGLSAGSLFSLQQSGVRDSRRNHPAVGWQAMVPVLERSHTDADGDDGYRARDHQRNERAQRCRLSAIF